MSSKKTGSKSAQETFPWTGRIVPWSAALRKQPRKTPREPSLADLPRDTRLKVVGREGGWLRVEVSLGGGMCNGYVSQELIATAPAATAGIPSKSAASRQATPYELAQ
jgi:hypothetical protein